MTRSGASIPSLTHRFHLLTYIPTIDACPLSLHQSINPVISYIHILSAATRCQLRRHYALVKNTVKHRPKEKPFQYGLGTAMQPSVL